MTNVLTAYFSWRNNKKQRKKSANIVNGNLYEIEPELPYTKADLNFMTKTAEALLK